MGFTKRLKLSHISLSQVKPVLLPGIFVLSVSLLLRIWTLGNANYWIDEMSSVHFAGNDQWGALLWDNSPPLYHFILKIWIFLFGPTEAPTRSLSAIISVVTTFVWAREGFLRGGRAGLFLAGGLHALLALSVWYARETRMYALFELASTLFFIQMFHILEDKIPSLKKLAAILLFMISTHYLAVLPIFTGLMGILFFKFKRIPDNYIRVLFVAFLVALIDISFIRWTSLAWQESKFAIEPTSRWPWKTILEILGGPYAALSVLAAGFIAAPKLAPINRFALFCFVSIFAAATIVGFAAHRSVFLPRYFIYAAPLVIGYFLSCPFLNEGFKKNRIASLAWGLAAGIFVFFQAQQALAYLNKINPPWRETAEYLKRYPNAVVYTTRPLSLRSPYFDLAMVDLVKLSHDDIEDFEVLTNTRYYGAEAWLLENYWGLEYYKNNLYAALDAKGCRIHDHSQENGSTDKVILLQIFCGEPQ